MQPCSPLWLLKLVGADVGTPAVVRLLADPQPSADIWNIHALPKMHVSLPKQANDLLCTVIDSSSKNPFKPHTGDEDSLTRTGSGFGEGVT